MNSELFCSDCFKKDYNTIKTSPYKYPYLLYMVWFCYEQEVVALFVIAISTHLQRTFFVNFATYCSIYFGSNQMLITAWKYTERKRQRNDYLLPYSKGQGLFSDLFKIDLGNCLRQLMSQLHRHLLFEKS